MSFEFDFSPEPPESVREFRRRLRKLREKCGNPTAAQMRQAIQTASVPRLKAPTLSEFASDKRPDSLPGDNFIQAYVAACLLYHKKSPSQVAELSRLFLSWRGHLLLASGKAVVVPAEAEIPEVPSALSKSNDESRSTAQSTMDTQPSEEAQPATTRNRENNLRFRLPQARVTIGVVLSVLLGFLLGGAVFGDWKSTAPDPSLAYNNCAESVEVSNRVGSIVLLADRGPRGKPEPDRRIELRAQKHPTRGWIVWTYFAQSTSSLDRLWIDWSYVSAPSDPSTYRQCGPQPITEDAATHGLLATDETGRARWFRACGQVPTQDRAPDQSGTICTSWTRPQV